MVYREIRRSAGALWRGFSRRRELQFNSVIVNGPTFHSDGMTLSNSSDCLNDPDIARAYRDSLAVGDWRGDGSLHDMRWRYYIVCRAAQLAFSLPGDFVECGVYRGGYARAILSYLPFKQSGRTYHMLDTFEGLKADLVTESEKERGILSAYAHYDECYEDVRRMFADDPVKIIRGAVPGTLAQCEARQIAYLSLDMNCAQPEVDAAEYFWDRITPGGVILHDDYNFPLHVEQRHAMDDFAKRKNAVLIALPTGQAMIFKPHARS